MLKFTRSFPRGFILLALLIFILPGSWLNPVGLSLLTPLRPISSLCSSLTSTSDETDKISILEKEKQDLLTELNILRNQNRELAIKLKQVADFVETQPEALNINKFYKIIVADVIISNDASSWRKSIVINRGTSNGIARGLPVISGKYLVGKISAPGLFMSRVQLITDPSFRSKAMVIPGSETSGRSRLFGGPPKRLGGDNTARAGMGVLTGYSTNQCLLKWVSRDIPVKPGWQVFSASNPRRTGTPCPKNLMVGKVTQVKEESYFYRLTIKPAINLNSLESVMVLKKMEQNED